MDEQLYSFAQLRNMPPLSNLARRISLPGLFRWHSRGIRLPDGSRVYLEIQRFGHLIVTSPANVQKFLDAINAGHRRQTEPAAPTPRVGKARTRRQRERSQADAKRKLAAAGI